MIERDECIKRLLVTMDYYNIQTEKIKNKEYVMLSTIEKHCISIGKNIDEFFHYMENQAFSISQEEVLTTLPLPLIMKAVDTIRREKNLSKHLISRNMEMDRANYQKLYKSKGSINFISFIKILNALDVDIMTFLERCRAIQSGRYRWNIEGFFLSDFQ